MGRQVVTLAALVLHAVVPLVRPLMRRHHRGTRGPPIAWAVPGKHPLVSQHRRARDPTLLLGRGSLSTRPAVVVMVVPLTYAAELATTAAALVAPGKGIMATDESPGTLAGRFAAAGLAPGGDDDELRNELSEETGFVVSEEEEEEDEEDAAQLLMFEDSKALRLAYRRALYEAPDLGKFVSGAILSEEALFDEDCVSSLIGAQKSIICGARADLASLWLPGARPGELWTTGIDSLDARAASYRDAGARFAKWRARFKISERDGAPSALAVKENCWTMARAARTLQELGLVPVIEPVVLSADADHAIERTAEIQERIYVEVFRAMAENGVFLEGLVFAPAMTTQGRDHAFQGSSTVTPPPSLLPRDIDDGLSSPLAAAASSRRQHPQSTNQMGSAQRQNDGNFLRNNNGATKPNGGAAVSPELVAAYSIRTLERTVPSAVPGVAFNSGGLAEEDASLCLDAMNRLQRKGPWSVTFGFARSLQASALATWAAGVADNRRSLRRRTRRRRRRLRLAGANGALLSDDEDDDDGEYDAAPGHVAGAAATAQAQAMLLARARANAAANLGNYRAGSQPSIDDTPSLFDFMGGSDGKKNGQ